MDTLTMIIEEMKKNNISQKEMCRQLGIHQQAFTNWKNGTTDSYMKKLPQIADVLGVSVDYLLQDDPALQQQKKPALNEDEPIDEVRRKLHAIIDTLSESDKEAMLFMAQSLMQRGEGK